MNSQNSILRGRPCGVRINIDVIGKGASYDKIHAFCRDGPGFISLNKSSLAPPDRFEAFYWPDEAAEIAIERLNGRRLRRGWLRVYMPEVGSSRELVDEFGRRGRDERPVRFVVYIWLIDRNVYHNQLADICAQAMGFISLRLKRRFFAWKQAEAFYRTAENAESAVRLLQGLQLGRLPLQASTDRRFLAWASKPGESEQEGGYHDFDNRLNRDRSLKAEPAEPAVVEYVQPVVHVDERGIQRHMSRGTIMHYPRAGYSVWKEKCRD